MRYADIDEVVTNLEEAVIDQISANHAKTDNGKKVLKLLNDAKEAINEIMDNLPEEEEEEDDEEDGV